MSPRHTPLVKTRRRKKNALPLQRGRKEKEGRPNGGGRRVQEEEDPSAGLRPDTDEDEEEWPGRARHPAKSEVFRYQSNS